MIDQSSRRGVYSSEREDTPQTAGRGSMKVMEETLGVNLHTPVTTECVGSVARIHGSDPRRSDVLSSVDLSSKADG